MSRSLIFSPPIPSTDTHHRSARRPHYHRPVYCRALRVERLEDRRLLASVTVDTVLDVVDFNDGVTSLREALFATNLVDGPDVINFDFGHDRPATIRLTQGDLPIADELTILGPGAHLLAIDASGNDPTPNSTPNDENYDDDGDGSRIFLIDDGDVLVDSPVTIHGLMLTGGDVYEYGGAILARETITVTSSTISDNFLDRLSFYTGGGICAFGDVVVSESTISGNSAAWGGGGILARGNVTVTSSTISGNEGGGILAVGNLTVTSSTISGNLAVWRSGGIYASGNVTIASSMISENEGGGIFIYGDGNVTATSSTIVGNGGSGIHAGGDVTVNGSTIAGNSAIWIGGGIVAAGDVTVTSSTIAGNSAVSRGGGIFASSNVTVTSSTIAGNSADRGGGISAVGKVTVTGSTISGNSAGDTGGGIDGGSGPVTVSASTISENSADWGGGIYATDGPVTITSSIVAGNWRSNYADPPVADDLAGSGAFGVQYSLIGVNTGTALIEAPVGMPDANGNLIGGPVGGIIDPLLGPLADNGGPTMPDGSKMLTHALLAGSPAINAGDLNAVAGVGGVPLFDQRSAPFGRVFNHRIDVGAFECQEASDLNLLVDTLADESDGDYRRGDLSLREATELANSAASVDTIRFDAALSGGTILLTRGQLAISDTLTIMGPGADVLTIDASGNDPTPDENNRDGSRIFNINDNVAGNQILVEISGLFLTGGDVNGNGGAINSSEDLTLISSTISGNSAAEQFFGAKGGAIYSSKNLTLINSTINGNSAGGNGGGPWSGQGGGIYAFNLTVTNGSISGNTAGSSGGGVFAAGDATITDSAILGNSAGSCGGVYARGEVIAIGTTISGNSASRGSGGGIAAGGNVTVTASTISENSARRDGGGVSGYSLTVTNSMISDNSAGGNGGGIHKVSLDDLTVIASTISGNSAGGDGGGIDNYAGVLTIMASTISGNIAGRDGGGISSSYVELNISDSTISANSARFGGGISGFGIDVLSVSNSTISANSAALSGGGINNRYGVLTIADSTIAGNFAGPLEWLGLIGGGGGIYANVGPVTITCSIVAGNLRKSDTDPTVADDLAGNGSFTLGYSLVRAAVGAINTLPGTINYFGVDPRLGPLADNGGPTWTHALLPGSPAIDAGDPLAVPGENGVPLDDQRGVPFARVDVLGGRRIDVGAYELHPPAALPGDYNQNGIVDAADYTVWRNGLGGTVTPYTAADGNGDCTIDGTDYAVWKTQFGQTLRPPSVSSRSLIAELLLDAVVIAPEASVATAPGNESAGTDSYFAATTSDTIARPVRRSLPETRRALPRGELFFALRSLADDDHGNGGESFWLDTRTKSSDALNFHLRDHVFELLGRNRELSLAL